MASLTYRLILPLSRSLNIKGFKEVIFFIKLTFPPGIVSVTLQISNIFNISLAQKWYCHLFWPLQWLCWKQTWGSISVNADSTPDQLRWSSWSWWRAKWKSEIKYYPEVALIRVQAKLPAAPPWLGFPNNLWKHQHYHSLSGSSHSTTCHLVVFAILVVDVFRLAAVPKCLVSQDTALSNWITPHPLLVEQAR